jgi:hypothetical protein
LAADESNVRTHSRNTKSYAGYIRVGDFGKKDRELLREIESDNFYEEINAGTERIPLNFKAALDRAKEHLK